MSLQETDQNLSTTNNTIPDPQSLMPAPFVQLPQPTVSVQPAIAGPSTVESDHRIPASVPSSQIDFIKSNRGKPKMVHGGYIYNYHKDRANGYIAWRCEQYSQGARLNGTACNATAVTTGTYSSSTLHYARDHNHPPFTGCVGARKVKNKIKAAASQDKTAKPYKIVSDSLHNATDMTCNMLPDDGSLKRNVQRQRKRDKIATNPDLTLACDTSLLLLQIPPTLLSSWVVFDSGPSDTRIIMLTSEANLDFLSQSMRWCGDGTFKAAPKLFTQLYTINGQKIGYTVPCVYALLPNKRKETYVRLFRQIKSWLDVAGRQWLFESFLSDYEHGAFNAVLEVFPGIGEEGCFFHLCKRLDFQVKRFGLMTKYQMDDEFKLRVKMLAALAFVPVSDVISTYESLAVTFLDDELPLLSYFELTWIGQEVGGTGRRLPPMFSHHMWNVLDRADSGSTRTTNALESFHHSFNSLLSCAHPTVWKLLESLEAQQNQTRLRMLKISRGDIFVPSAINSGRNKRIRNLVSSYTRPNALNFIRGIAYNYLS